MLWTSCYRRGGSAVAVRIDMLYLVLEVIVGDPLCFVTACVFVSCEAVVVGI